MLLLHVFCREPSSSISDHEENAIRIAYPSSEVRQKNGLLRDKNPGCSLQPEVRFEYRTAGISPRKRDVSQPASLTPNFFEGNFGLVSAFRQSDGIIFECAMTRTESLFGSRGATIAVEWLEGR